MATNNRHGRQSSYVYGNNAYDMDIVAMVNAPADGEMLREAQGRVKEAKKNHMSLGNVIFMTIAMAVLCLSLVSYLRLQVEITTMNERVSKYEATLNNLTLENDDEYSKISNVVDFEEIKRVAIEELGMTYATQDQIITYEKENSDYVRQLKKIRE